MRAGSAAFKAMYQRRDKERAERASLAVDKRKLELALEILDARWTAAMDAGDENAEWRWSQAWAVGNRMLVDLECRKPFAQHPLSTLVPNALIRAVCDVARVYGAVGV